MKLLRCLQDLGIAEASIFKECDDVNEEFKVIRKIYLKKALQEHPDKGGNPEIFRTTQVSWEVLRDVFDRNTVHKGSFTSYFSSRTTTSSSTRANDIGVATTTREEEDDDSDEDYDDELYEKYSKNSSYPSYQYYEDAEKEDVPIYKVEPARSDRSKCQRCKLNIPKCGIRIGSIDIDAGTYGRWMHLDCWRVPLKIQYGLTNFHDEQASLVDLIAMEEVLLTGVKSLDNASQLVFVQHCVNAEHWAGNTTKKRKAAAMKSRENVVGSTSTNNDNDPTAASSKFTKTSSAKPNTTASSDSNNNYDNTTTGTASSEFAAKDSTSSSTSTSTTVEAPSTSFPVLVPGLNGARDANFFLGLTFVLTGIFPEAGGGGGGGNDSDVGVANITTMIQLFGGKVNARFSKNTNFLLAGINPNKNKFMDAVKRSIQVVSWQRIQNLLLGSMNSLEELASMPSLTFADFGISFHSATSSPPNNNIPSYHSFQESSTRQATESTTIQIPSSANPPKTNEKSSNNIKPEDISIGAASATSTYAPMVSTSIVPSNRDYPVVSTAIVSHTGKKGKFIIPKPGVNGAIAGVLSNKRFVLTGLFPEVGGGAGLNLGKDRAKSMIESFGGKVTSSVSGKTDFVLVGHEPGRSKVTQAEQRNIPLIDLLSLHRLLLGQQTITATASAPPPRITSFSAGYAGQQRIGYY